MSALSREKKSGAINGRISADLRARLDAIQRRYGPTDATMLEDALTALADYVDAAGKYERPMRMVHADEARALNWALNENAPQELRASMLGEIRRLQGAQPPVPPAPRDRHR